jgi:hypothetical protein
MVENVIPKVKYCSWCSGDMAVCLFSMTPAECLSFGFALQVTCHLSEYQSVHLTYMVPIKQAVSVCTI